MKVVRRVTVRAIAGCLCVLSFSVSAFAQQIPCPVSSNFTMSDSPAVNAIAGCFVNFGVTLTNQGNLASFENEPGATLINNGTLNNSAFTTIINSLGATLTNFGTLNNSGGIANAGTLTNADSYNNAGTLGNSGTLNNAGSLTNYSGVQITNTGTLTNFFGATLTNAGTLDNQVGATLTNDGALINDAGLGINFGSSLSNSGTLNNNGTLTIARNAFLDNLPGATLNNVAGAIINGDLGNLGLLVNDGTVNGRIDNSTHGTLSGIGTINGDVSNDSGGIVQPGDAPGTLTINGNYTQGSGGTLTIDLGGTGAGLFSVLNVSGLTTLDGTVDFTAVNGFTPGTGDDFTFLLFGTTSGDFAHIDFTNWTCPAGDTCTDVFGPNSLTLEIAPAAVPTPEPSALLLLGTGVLALSGYSRRKRAAAKG